MDIRNGLQCELAVEEVLDGVLHNMYMADTNLKFKETERGIPSIFTYILIPHRLAQHYLFKFLAHILLIELN